MNHTSNKPSIRSEGVSVNFCTLSKIVGIFSILSQPDIYND
jgi:hypothetical protein